MNIRICFANLLIGFALASPALADGTGTSATEVASQSSGNIFKRSDDPLQSKSRADLFRTTMLPYISYDTFQFMIWSKNPVWEENSIFCGREESRTEGETLAAYIRRVDNNGWRLSIACPEARVSYRDVAESLRDYSREGRLLRILFGDASQVCHPQIDDSLEGLGREGFARAYLVQGTMRMKCGRKYGARLSFERAYGDDTVGESVREARSLLRTHEQYLLGTCSNAWSDPQTGICLPPKN